MAGYSGTELPPSPDGELSLTNPFELCLLVTPPNVAPIVLICDEVGTSNWEDLSDSILRQFVQPKANQ